VSGTKTLWAYLWEDVIVHDLMDYSTSCEAVKPIFIQGFNHEDISIDVGIESCPIDLKI
jgi:hypothetical protein